MHVPLLHTYQYSPLTLVYTASALELTKPTGFTLKEFLEDTIEEEPTAWSTKPCQQEQLLTQSNNNATLLRKLNILIGY